MQQATLCADGWACARSAERVLRAATSLKRHRLPTRYRSALNLGELKSGPDTSSAGRDRIGMGGAGHGTGHVVLPSESRRICPSTGSVRTREAGTGVVPRSGPDTFREQPNGPDRGHFHRKGTKAQRTPTCCVMFCFVCDLRSGPIELGRDTNSGTGFVSGRAGSGPLPTWGAGRDRLFHRENRRNSCGAKLGRDRIGTGRDGKRSQPTEFRRRLHHQGTKTPRRDLGLKPAILLCLGALVVKSLSNLA